MSSNEQSMNVTVIGIGNIGGGMCRALLASRATRTVVGYDMAEALVSAFHAEATKAGKAISSSLPTSLKEAVTEATDAVILTLVNERQCQEVCFGSDGNSLVSLMKPGSCLILCSTVTAQWARTARDMFASKDVNFVDCPVSGGAARALTGDLTLMAGGDKKSLAMARPLLDAAGREVHVIPGGAGMGQTVKMVHQLLAGVHIVCAAEALALAAKAGVDVDQMYEIVNGAAGASWMFGDRGKRMIGEGEAKVMSVMPIIVKDLDIVYSEAKALQSPIPLARVALQQFISAQGLGLDKKDDSQVVKVYEKITGIPVGKKSGSRSSAGRGKPSVVSECSMSVTVIGIGNIGGGMCRALLKSQATSTVVGYDMAEALVSAFHAEATKAGKAISSSLPTSLKEAVTETTDAVILTLVNERQCQEVCFGSDGNSLVSLMKPGSCLILCSTVTAQWARTARDMFASKDINFVDCPVSGGAARALTGDLTLMAGGDKKSLAMARPLLDAVGREVHVISGGAGMGQTVKMVHQLLAGVHIVCAAEALALAAKAGVDVGQMYEIVNGAAGASWMFGDRGKRMIGEGEPEVMSMIDIFVKDLDIVYTEAKNVKSPIPLASVALDQFVSAQGLGLGGKDDSQVVKVYEQITGVPVGRRN